MCGSNGITYGNECNFRCARKTNPNISLRHNGACRSNRGKRAAANEELCLCTQELHLICGTNGVTYDNPCLLKCAAKTRPDLKVAKEGPCEGGKEQKTYTCACPKHYNPICGSDGTTYGNECTFRCAQNSNPDLILNRKGRCLKTGRSKRSAPKEELCPCTKERRLVCGTDGRTYGNPCQLKCAAKYKPGLKIVHFGPCLVNSIKSSWKIPSDVCVSI